MFKFDGDKKDHLRPLKLFAYVWRTSWQLFATSNELCREKNNIRSFFAYQKASLKKCLRRLERLNDIFIHFIGGQLSPHSRVLICERGHRTNDTRTSRDHHCTLAFYKFERLTWSFAQPADVERRQNPVCHFVTPLDGNIDLEAHRSSEVTV